MSKPVEEMAKTSNEVAALAKAAKDYRTASITLLLVLGLGAPKELVLKETDRMTEAMKTLSAALKPFDTEPQTA